MSVPVVRGLVMSFEPYPKAGDVCFSGAIRDFAGRNAAGKSDSPDDLVSRVFPARRPRFLLLAAAIPKTAAKAISAPQTALGPHCSMALALGCLHMGSAMR